MTPISTLPARTTRTPPSAISPSRHTSISAIASLFLDPALRLDATTSLPPAVELRHVEILPARDVGDVVERLPERARGIDADAGRDPHGAVPAEIDRRVGWPGRRVLDYDHVALRLHAEGQRPFDLGRRVHVDVGVDDDG